MQGLPAPPPSIAYDVNEFRRFFKFGLDQLHSNNKYIINDLTTLASVYHHRMSTYIVKDIEQHIRNSHPSHRLIGFYVLDSICKNLGHPFPQLFKPFIERLFLIAYRDIEDVDPITKVKFEELLGTWRTGSTNQTELFDPDIQKRIEESVFGNWRRADSVASQAFLNGIKQQPAVATPAEKASILYDVRRILSEREQTAAAYPGDETNLAQIATLQQLDQLIVSQQLTINQVDDIRNQLQPLKAPPAPLECGIPPSHLPAAVPQVPSHPHPIQPFGDSDSLANLTRLLETNPDILLQAINHSTTPTTPVPQHTSAQQHHTSFNLDSTGQLVFNNVSQHLQPPLGASVPHLVGQEVTNPAIFDSEQLAAALASLNPAGYNGLPLELGSSLDRPIEIQPSPAPSTLSTSESLPTCHTDPAIAEYENMIAGLPIELQNSSINRVKAADIADILYSHIPQFCRQDGSRFLYGKIGSQRASEQLDRHFRLQRRVRESGQRVQQRMWSQSESEWLDSHDFGTKANGENSAGDKSQANKKKSAEEEKSMTELSKKSIIRPSSPGLASQPCPICQETFETRFDEDEGEFYWTNAIELTRDAGKRVVYHATCHYETIRNKARMKIKSELEENRLKKQIQMEAERQARSEGGNHGEPGPAEVVANALAPLEQPGEAGNSSSRCNKVAQPVDSTTPATVAAAAAAAGGGDDDDDEKCLLQVDERFFGDTETTKPKLESSSSFDPPLPALPGSSSSELPASLPVVHNNNYTHIKVEEVEEEKPSHTPDNNPLVTRLLPASSSSSSPSPMLRKRKSSSPIENLVSSSCALVPEPNEMSSKKFKLS
ncbi:hypothetical protein PCANC_04749 [Puccinia coronata f. sp. avenae]|uniref:CID domain-containing protein n=1 Tax=Puccinia coronata f. sp. avenae TaxID=200324 RepID=A0A2N5VWV3_9BASI|nr:hypothetical protein PCANC_04749 [Puccinia coronata f. sp. avenae]